MKFAVHKPVVLLSRTVLLCLIAGVGVSSFASFGQASTRAIRGTAHDARIGIRSGYSGILASRTLGGVARAVRTLFQVGEEAIGVDRAPHFLRTIDWKTQRYAFGNDDNPIQFSFELEGNHARGVTDYYRPSELPEEAWWKMSDSARAEYVRGRVPVTWNGWVRREGSPSWMHETLFTEADGAVWEIKSAGHVDTLDEMWRQVSLLRQDTGSTAFHFHVTFQPDRQWAKEVAAYLAHMDESFTTQMYDRASGRRRLGLIKAKFKSEQEPVLLFSNVAHRFLRPQREAHLQAIARGLADSLAEISLTHKLHSVGFRDDVYDALNRVGYELRAVSKDAQFNRAWLEQTVSFLENPRETVLGEAADGVPITIDELIEMDHLSQASLDRLGAEAVVPTLQEIADRGHSARAERVSYDAMHWSYPMLNWEGRPHLANRTQAIQHARNRFVRRVAEIAAEFQGASEGAKYSRRWADSLNYAVETFVHRSGIAEPSHAQATSR